MLVSLSALLVFAGSACLIAAMYVQAATLPLVFAGRRVAGHRVRRAVFMLWQRYFASLPSAEATCGSSWARPSRRSSTLRCTSCPSR